MILTILYLVSILDATAFSMVITIMTPYIFSLGGTQYFMGVMGSVTALIGLLWSPIVGSLSDRLGRKKVLLQLLAICLIGNVMTACCTSLAVFFIARTLTALGMQIMTLIKSLTDDNIKSKDDKMNAISKMQALGAFSFILGPLASGHISEYVNGMTYIFYLVSAIFGINFVLISLIKETHTQQNAPDKDHTPSFSIFREINVATKNLANINWPRYWDLFIIKLIIDFSFGVFQFNSSILLLKRFGIVGKSFGYVIATMSVLMIVANLAMMKVKAFFYSNDESGLKRLLHGNIFLIITFIGMGLSTNVGVFMIFLIPMSIARVLIEITLTEVLLGRASPEEKGSIMGTFDSTIPLGGLVAPLLSGIIADTWGEGTCILLCVLPITFGAVLSYYQKIKLQ